MTVDTDQPGQLYEGVGPNATIPAGTVVDCYIAHYDAVGSGGSTAGSSLTFAGTILGVICSNVTLDVSDPILGAPGTAYPTGNISRRFEQGNDVAFLSDDKTTVHLDVNSVGGAWIDQIRILTAPGADASYGMNNQVTSRQVLEAHQVLMAGYGKSVIDFDYQGETNDDSSWLELRHHGRSNVLLGDGSVKLLGTAEFFEPDQPHWGAFRNRYPGP